MRWIISHILPTLIKGDLSTKWQAWILLQFLLQLLKSSKIRNIFGVREIDNQDGIFSYFLANSYDHLFLVNLIHFFRIWNKFCKGYKACDYCRRKGSTSETLRHFLYSSFSCSYQLLQALFPLHVHISSSFSSILLLGYLIHVYYIYLIQDSCHPISVWIIGISHSYVSALSVNLLA